MQHRFYIKKAVLLVSYLFISIGMSSSQAEAGARCFAYKSKQLNKKVQYCVQNSKGLEPQKNEPVFYYMHGIFGKAKSWIQDGYADALETYGQDPATPSFTVISFDTSKMSFFSDPKKVHPGKKAYETWLLKEFIPMMESKYGVCSERKCRGLIGTSMGGFGAIKMALRYPEQFFLVAANSPALPPFDLTEGTTKFLKYFFRHPVGPLRGIFYLYVFRKIFPQHSEYTVQNDPLYLVKEFSDKSLFPKLYFDVGTKDDYGFQEGFARFVNELNKTDYPYESVLVEGANHHITKQQRWPLLKFVIQNLK